MKARRAAHAAHASLAPVAPADQPIPNLHPPIRGTSGVVQANAESTGGTLSAWESIFPGGAASPLHLHNDSAEFFYILKGEVSFYLDGRWFDAEPGAFIAVPKGARHGFRVSSRKARLLAMFSPATMLEMWEEIAAVGGRVDRGTYVFLARKYRMEEFRTPARPVIR